MRRIAMMLVAATVAGVATMQRASAADTVVACPTQHLRVVRSAGGVIDYLGHVRGIPELCRVSRTIDGEGEFYFGQWRADWPGAGLAYPALWAALHGPAGTRTTFVTRSYPGLQWTDSFTNQGIETVMVDGVAHRAIRLAHERDGIEGNTYHSVITQWRDVATGVALRTFEQQISGKSYGPETTWQALRIEKLP
jgi:hypothetical protein